MLVSFLVDGTKVCAGNSMKKWLKVRPKKSKWLFCHKNKKPVKTTWVQTILKQKLVSMEGGYSIPQFISGMSLRRGGALTMAQCGVPDRVIQASGRWKSDAYRVYLELTEQEKSMWAQVISNRVNLGKPARSLAGEPALARIIEPRR